jgi:hypothetical protein
MTNMLIILVVTLNQAKVSLDQAKYNLPARNNQILHSLRSFGMPGGNAND